MQPDPQSRSIWDVTERTSFPALDEDLAVDVVVIGAGITGITAALRLAEAGKRVVVVEARTICSGVTGYTTAHITENIDGRYAEIAKTFGEETSVTVARAVRAAIDHISGRVRDLAIDCDLQIVPGILFTEREEERDELLEEYRAATAAGVAVELDPKVTLPFLAPFKAFAAIKYAEQARFNPSDYVHGLVDAAVKLGVRIYEQSRVVSVVDGAPCEVVLENGLRLSAGAVICATHVPLNRLLLQTKLGHYQSYVCAYRHAPSIPDALFWDNQDPYHYVRVANLAGERFLLVGGEDHKTGENQDTRNAFDRLIAYASERFGCAQPDFRWSAQVHESIDGLPLIGRNSGDQNVYVASGLAGDGMTFGSVAGLLLSDLILGHDNAWQRVFDATRVTPSAVGNFVRENASVPLHLIGDRLRGSEVESLGDIDNGDGKIMRREGRRLAVHRDDQGALHAVSAICPHMGCVVAFNRAEKTWDCPCHGSRFAVDGTIVEGPAVQALAPCPLADEARSATAAAAEKAS